MCVGVYHPDGRCGQCGRALGPDDPEALREGVAALAEGAATAPEAPSAPETPSLGGSEPDVGVAAPHEASEPDSDIDALRRPCDDAMCTGVFDDAGRCGTCGRVAAGP
ncbi:MAG: hypothetical protein JNK72_11120 [Myxococcales bacterium]|nr:hypothetical protein [Myxococcales bacterium]